MYNNPFMYGYPSVAANFARPAVGRGLLSGLKAINWGGILTNTQKTLGVINQAIPIVYQVKPILGNAKTMFKIANSIRGDTSSNRNNSTVNNNTVQSSSNVVSDNKPIFFI